MHRNITVSTTDPDTNPSPSHAKVPGKHSVGCRNSISLVSANSVYYHVNQSVR